MAVALLTFLGLLNCVCSLPPPLSSSRFYKEESVPFEETGFNGDHIRGITNDEILKSQYQQFGGIVSDRHRQSQQELVKDKAENFENPVSTPFDETSKIHYDNSDFLQPTILQTKDDIETTEILHENVTHPPESTDKATPEITFFHLTNVRNNNNCLKDPNGKCRDEYK